MWLHFLIDLPIFALLLYVPGFLLARSLSRDGMLCLAMAPLLSTVVYALLTILYGALGVFTTTASLVMPAALAGAVCLVVRWRFDGKSGKDGASPFGLKELELYAPYIVVGVAVCLIYFIKKLDGPGSFTWRTDNTWHLNLVWRFVKSGDWSMLHTSLYEDPTRAAITANGFYPAGWHLLPSLVVQALGVSPAFAANVVNAVLIGITIPTSQYLLVRTTFGDKPLAVRLGAIFPLAFGVFPWHIIIPEAKESFFYGMVLAPACISAFVIACENALNKKLALRDVAFALLGILACALAHPISVFSVGVLLVPYCLWAIWRASTVTEGRYSRKTSSTVKGLVWDAAFLAFVVVVWAICFHIPTIYEMTTWIHWSYTNLKEAILRVVFMGYKDVPPQPLLALFVWTGIVYSLYRKRYLWLTGGFLTFSAFYIVDAITDNIVKRILTGFWYTDFNRLAASACIIAVPLAALGLYAWVRVVQEAFRHIAADNKDSRRFRIVVVPSLCLLATLLVIYYPSFQMPHQPNRTLTAFGYTSRQAKKFNSQKNTAIDEEEVDFLDEVKDVVGDDLVLNCPSDGSAFAYATNDVNVYCRRYSVVYMNEDAQYLLREIDHISTDVEAQEIAEKLDAHYVLLLDEGFQEDSSVEWDYFGQDASSGEWRGFVDITDQTPGLEPVLSEGDMRLYRIEDEAA